MRTDFKVGDRARSIALLLMLMGWVGQSGCGILLPTYRVSTVPICQSISLNGNVRECGEDTNCFLYFGSNLELAGVTVHGRCLEFYVTPSALGYLSLDSGEIVVVNRDSIKAEVHTPIDGYPGYNSGFERVTGEFRVLPGQQRQICLSATPKIDDRWVSYRLPVKFGETSLSLQVNYGEKTNGAWVSPMQGLVGGG